MYHIMKKSSFCLCKNNGTADQRFCFRYIYVDSTIPLLSKFEISSLYIAIFYAMSVQPGLCQIWLETPKTGFLVRQIKYEPSCKPVFSEA